MLRKTILEVGREYEVPKGAIRSCSTASDGIPWAPTECSRWNLPEFPWDLTAPTTSQVGSRGMSCGFPCGKSHDIPRDVVGCRGIPPGMSWAAAASRDIPCGIPRHPLGSHWTPHGTRQEAQKCESCKIRYNKYHNPYTKGVRVDGIN